MRKPKLVEEHEAAGRRLLVHGQNIFVRERGEGEPVLLLHGVPSSSLLYRKVLDPLAAAGLHAISFDFPGMGLSDKPPQIGYDWHSLSHWVGWVVDALGLPRVHLVIHDIAGPIGAEWAIENADRLHSLTITNCMLDLASFRPTFPMSMLRVPGLRELAFSGMSPSVLQVLFKRIGVSDATVVDHELMESYLYLLRQGGGRQSFLSIMSGFDLSESHGHYLREGLLSLETPIQLVWGERDPAIPKAQLEYIRQALPLRAAHLLPAKHFLQEDQAELLAAHIAEFAAQLRNCP